MLPQKMNEKEKTDLASCRICLLSKSNCAECPLNWAIQLVGIEQTFQDMKTIEISVEIFEITDEWIENNPDDAIESLWLSTLED